MGFVTVRIQFRAFNCQESAFSTLMFDCWWQPGLKGVQPGIPANDRNGNKTTDCAVVFHRESSYLAG